MDRQRLGLVGLIGDDEDDSPAPTDAGDSETRALLMYTVRLTTGTAGRGSFAKCPLLPAARHSEQRNCNR